MKVFKLPHSPIASICATLLITGALHAFAGEAPEPSEITIGERLFLETRFAQAYFSNPAKADPAVSHTDTSNGQLPGPFRGKTMNCRNCHMVDEHQHTDGAGMRSYADFAARTAVPERSDVRKTTRRNAMSMVNVSIAREHGELFHFDGEFNSLEDLVRATVTGRDYGWLRGEKQTAIAHIARVIRDDDGNGELASEFGGSYRKVLLGTAKDLGTEHTLPAAYRIDVDKASDQQILDTVARLIAAYLRDLTFSTDENGRYNGSPYDRFLDLNKLPRAADPDESQAAYNQRLLDAVNSLKTPHFVTAQEGKFAYHKQAFEFGAQELAGMKLFLSRGSDAQRGGNCSACHQAPHFSDFSFHNTGLTQVNYDGLHGAGKFMQLDIPDLATRNENYDLYLPATEQHIKASSRFRRAAAKDKAGITDLGLWNVYANPDMPNPQAKLNNILCSRLKQNNRKAGADQCKPQLLLPMTIAAFKTPVLRDLGHSNPYMHSGQFNELDDAVRFYITSSTLAKNKILRNADPALQHINLAEDDIDALVSFVEALNEDYD
jgi:cytochrome c peroxidase